MKKIKTIVIAMAAAAMLTACGTSRKTVDTVPPTKTTTTPTQPAKSTHSGVQHFISDLDVSIGMNSGSYDLGGKMAVKENEVVRVNLTFMGFIEVGTIEFTPEYILIINRMGKEYTKMGYKDWDVLVKNNITYQEVEDKAWQKVYAASGKNATDDSFDKAIQDMLASNVKGGKNINVKIKVGKPDTKKEFETRTNVKSSYTEVPAQTLIAKLMSFAK